MVASFNLPHSRVIIQASPAGLVARIERPGATEYAIVAPETVDALADLAGGATSA